VLENDSKKFEKENYFLLANAHVLHLKSDIEIEKKEFGGTEITPDTICQYFGSISNKDITGKQKGNTIWNLFRSNLLELQIPSNKEKEEIISSNITKV